MKVHEFGDKRNPVIMLFPGTMCYWRGNFDNVIDKLSKKFYVAAVAKIHVFYAKKMGEKYLERYQKYFKDPIIHEQDMRHEEFMGLHTDEWCALVEEICL